jgi:uncharacterized BrkB/YihY/UPF0761 family membrane protein
MATAKAEGFLHDRRVLLVLSVNVFLALVAILSVALRLPRGSSTIVQYRAPLGIDAFQSGGELSLVSFIVFAVVILGSHSLLAYRVYPIKHQLSLLVLLLGSLLFVVAAIVGSALLAVQ